MTKVGEHRHAETLLARMLENDFRDDAVAVVHERERLLETVGREAMRDDRIDIHQSVLEQPDHA